MKAYADDKIIITGTLKFVLGGVENIVGKEENAGFHNVFKTRLCQDHERLGLCGKELKMEYPHCCLY